MNKDDFVIQSEVRRMLIRADVDYTKIDFGTVRGVVYLRGVFRPIHAPTTSENAMRAYTVKTLLAFEKKIRSISGISDVIFQFVNWKKEKGHWIPTRTMKKEEQKQKPDEEQRQNEEEEKDEEKTASGL